MFPLICTNNNIKLIINFNLIVAFLCVLILTSSFNLCIAKKKDDELYPVLHYQRGIKLHRQGEFKNAVLALNDALALNPNDLPTLIELAQVLSKLDNYDLAISTYKQVLRLAPDDALAHTLLADTYVKAQQYENAISEYSLAVKLEPDNVLLLANIGFVCALKSNYDCTVDYLGKVVLAYPNQLQARSALGNAYHALKKYSLAKDQYRYVLKYEPRNLSLWYNLSKLEIALGDYEKALFSINRAISIDDSVSELYLDRGLIYYNLNKLEDAQNDYIIAIKKDPVNPVIPAEYGSFLWKTGAYLKAAKQYEKALALEPDNISFMHNKAFLLQLAQQHKHAILAWEDILNEDGKDKDALFNLAKLYQELEEYEDAIKYFRKFLAVTEEQGLKDLEAESSLAFCLHKGKKYDEAKEVYEGILSQRPDESKISYNLGVLLIEQAQYQPAVSSLQKSLSSGFTPESKIYEALISAYSKINDVTNLKTTYKKWLEIDKDNVQARIAYAKFLAKNNFKQEATEQYRVAAALDSTPESKFQLAKFLVDQKDQYGAIGQLQDYLKQKPKDLNALILLANAYKDLGIEEEAVNSYKKIISLQYDNHLAYYNLGLLFQKKENNELAQNYLLKSIELNDKYSPAYYALALSYMNGENNEKAKESFEKYLQIDPDGEYKEVIEDKLKELLSKPQEKKENAKA